MTSKQIASFTYEHVRYFLPDSPPVTLDADKEWTAQRAHFMLSECDVRPVRSEYTSNSGVSVEFVEN